jgi:hypothetical protein
MPKRLCTGQGWPVQRPRSGCGAQGTEPSRFFFCDGSAQTPGRLSFDYLSFGDAKKSNSPKAKDVNFIRGKHSMRASARDNRFGVSAV